MQRKGQKIQKYYVICVYILLGKMGKTEQKWNENNETKLIKRQKNQLTKLWDEQNIRIFPIGNLRNLCILNYI